MSITRYRTTRMSRSEYRVLNMLRLRRSDYTHATDALDEAADWVRLVAMKASDLGYEIRQTGAAYASLDELKLIGWLALHQRRHMDGAEPTHRVLIRTIRNAAAALDEAGCRLPFLTVLRTSIDPGPLPDALTPLPDRPVERHRIVSSRGLPRRPGMENSKRGRLVALAQSRGQVTTAELCTAGATRQYIAALCSQGALIRVRFGVYKAPPPDDTVKVVSRVSPATGSKSGQGRRTQYKVMSHRTTAAKLEIGGG